MSRLNLVLVSRRFWPLFGGAETAMANLAAGFLAHGHPTTLVTGRWNPEWPAEIDRRGVRVIRLAHPPQRGWGTWRYMRALSNWLESHRRQFDLILVSMLKHDAYAALSVARRQRFPVVLRAAGGGLTGDCQWQRHANFGRCIKRRCSQAAAIVAPSPAIQQELMAAGYPQEKLLFIPNGVAVGPVRQAARRTAARAALATGNAALGLATDTPLAIYTGRLHACKGLAHLVGAWPAVLRQQPDARLWLAGDGPDRASLQSQIQRLKVQNRVLLAGSFDGTEELLCAADLFVLPSLEEGMSQSLLEAMACGLPIVASDIPGNRDLIENNRDGLLVRVADPIELSAAVLRLLNEPGLAGQLGANARDRVGRHFSLEKMITAYLQLFDRLIMAN
jgi:glycosyltransferase involved in cell wall biosynthesis